MAVLTVSAYIQEEAIPESVKNILLVMADGGLLVLPSQDSSKEKIWVETRKRLDRFLPDLFLEIFPDASSVQDKSKSLPTSTVASPVVPPSQSANDEPVKEDDHGGSNQTVPVSDRDTTAEKE